MEKRFRIALSFAGAQRTYVAQMAHRLAGVFGRERILYDHFHAAEFARGDLAFYLSDLYREQSDLVVVIFSVEYQGKDWCGLEWSAAYSLIKQRRQEEVMLLRFGLFEAQAVSGLAGYLDLDERDPRAAADLILERLALNQRLPPDHYLRGASYAALPAESEVWPTAPPQLDWRVADHSVAREAFACLLMRDAPYRFLPIHGPSGTGKTLLSQQFLGNAMTKLTGLRCARLDFKGSAGLTSDVRDWAESLGVSPPPGDLSLLEKLKLVVAELKQVPRATLLIFDTFEASGDIDRWFTEALLVSAIRLPWLRLVVIGQAIPKPEGQAWASLSSRAIGLTIPTAADWHVFCRDQLKLKNIGLSFIEEFHAVVHGKPAMLANCFNNVPA